MNKQELEFVLQEGEGLKIEFKESFDKSIAKEIVAFANSEGGRIFLGIDDKGKQKGINITNKLKSQIQDLARNCDPSIHIEIESIDKVFIINVKEGIKKPYRCSAGFFLRQGSNSQKLSTEEIREFFNKEGKIFFDDVINNEFSFKNGFNKSKFEEFLKIAKLSKTISNEAILKSLGVLTETEKFKNAGVLFFCEDVERFFRHAIITCVLYKGVNKTFIIDRKDFHSDIYSNYNDAMNFLYKSLKLIYRIEGSGPRKEILEIPNDALKEVLINAIAHRDYSEKGANIQVDIFDDRVEISNPGGLIIKEEEFGKRSFTRNPLIFNLLQRLELVEQVGSGINRIREAMAKIGLKEPKFDSGKFFAVTLFKPSDEEIGRLSGAKTTPQATSQATPQAELTELEKRILKEIKNNPKISRKGLAEKLAIGADTIKEYLSKLKNKKALKRIGKTSSGYWEILEK